MKKRYANSNMNLCVTSGVLAHKFCVTIKRRNLAVFNIKFTSFVWRLVFIKYLRYFTLEGGGGGQ